MSQELDYREILEKLLELLGEHVDVHLRGSGGAPPVFATWGGELTRGGDVYGAEALDWDAESVEIPIGGVSLILHRDVISGGDWTEEHGRRVLTIYMGGVEVIFRAAPGLT